MSRYTPEFLGKLTDGQLADYYYETVDLDFHPEEGEESVPVSEDVRAIEAEVKRRGLSQDDLSRAWNKLAAEKGTPID